MLFNRKTKKEVPFIQQRDSSECGSVCLAMIFSYYGLKGANKILREMSNVSSFGTNLLALSETAKKFGFKTEGLKTSYKRLQEIEKPLIAHFEGNHFVVITNVNQETINIADPASGKLELEKEEFLSKWNGIVLKLTPTDNLFKDDNLVEFVKNNKQKEKFVVKEFYLSVLKPFKQHLIEIGIASFFISTLALALPFFTQAIIDKALTYQDSTLLIIFLSAMLFLFLIQTVLTYSRNMLISHFRTVLEFDFFSTFFNHFIHLKQQYFDTRRKEDFIQRFQENIKIRNFFSSSVIQSFIDTLFIANFLIVLFFYNINLALLSLLFVSIFIIITAVYTPKLKHMENSVFNENLKAMGSFIDTLNTMETVKTLNAQQVKFWEWQSKSRKALNSALKTEKTYIKLSSMQKTLIRFSQIVIYWIGAWNVFNKQLTIGQYIAFVTIYSLITSAIKNISNLWFMMTKVSVSFNKLNDVLIEEKEENPLSININTLEKPDITIKNLFFRYNRSSKHYNLKNINLHIKYGEHIGIAGRNGSGKSTLVKLLLNLYNHYEGEIYINDTEIRQIPLSILRKKIFLFSQETSLFAGSIKDNILIANPNASEEKLIEAGKLADLHKTVQKLYLGYNHYTGENGNTLSGGQKVKIAFARLFISNPDIIILDEAGSALDMEAEKKITDNLNEKFKNKTIITIAHRLHTLQNADKIIFLKEGEIAEQGSHEELVAKKENYYNMIKNHISY